MKKILILLAFIGIFLITASFAGANFGTPMGCMMGFNGNCGLIDGSGIWTASIFMLLFFILASFIFSLIFWLVYKWILKK